MATFNYTSSLIISGYYMGHNTLPPDHDPFCFKAFKTVGWKTYAPSAVPL